MKFLSCLLCCFSGDVLQNSPKEQDSDYIVNYIVNDKVFFSSRYDSDTARSNIPLKEIKKSDSSTQTDSAAEINKTSQSLINTLIQEVSLLKARNTSIITSAMHIEQDRDILKLERNKIERACRTLYKANAKLSGQIDHLVSERILLMQELEVYVEDKPKTKEESDD
ncbi:hypothetical protein [Candidatus Nesciobacter abundans]|uniref:Uncharacterized protein n=1 Tax=Candidatus Nesciobacter abundans TaxID=2601668 RepID=A0A5C0UFW0_9PROT|nr:hypothetical protein [Candidatus Nesciobacter abundans]QEK38938.1 hypothetical protein FZC36_00600 [Candidatus Nesciobacter abundans]